MGLRESVTLLGEARKHVEGMVAATESAKPIAITAQSAMGAPTQGFGGGGRITWEQARRNAGIEDLGVQGQVAASSGSAESTGLATYIAHFNPSGPTPLPTGPPESVIGIVLDGIFIPGSPVLSLDGGLVGIIGKDGSDLLALMGESGRTTQSAGAGGGAGGSRAGGSGGASQTGGKPGSPDFVPASGTQQGGTSGLTTLGAAMQGTTTNTAQALPLLQQIAQGIGVLVSRSASSDIGWRTGAVR